VFVLERGMDAAGGGYLRGRVGWKREGWERRRGSFCEGGLGLGIIEGGCGMDDGMTDKLRCFSM